MSAPAPALRNGHIHLPSVHIRGKNGSGFDYEEDLYVRGHGKRKRIERVVTFVAIEHGEPTLMRQTQDVLCEEETEQVVQDLPILMDEANPAARASMEECARREFARQMRIAAGQEQACASCGCSETRACSGGCVWATQRLCSRCA
jgi:hypothetical protein